MTLKYGPGFSGSSPVLRGLDLPFLGPFDNGIVLATASPLALSALVLERQRNKGSYQPGFLRARKLRSFALLDDTVL